MKPESLIQLLDELDEFTVLARESGAFAGVSTLLLVLISLAVGVRTSSVLWAFAALLAGFFATTLIRAIADTLADPQEEHGETLYSR